MLNTCQEGPGSRPGGIYMTGPVKKGHMAVKICILFKLFSRKPYIDFKVSENTKHFIS